MQTLARKMSALTSRDYAVRVALSLVIGTEAVLFGSLSLLAAISTGARHGKLIMLLAGLHAAHVVAGLLLAAWMLAMPPWRRDQLARLTSRYWYFIAIAWFVVGALVSAHRS